MVVSTELVVGGLLLLAVAVEVACAVGLLVLDNALDRLHFVGPATIVGPLAVAAAVWVEQGLDAASVKATLVLLLLVLSGPILSYVMARVVVERSRRP